MPEVKEAVETPKKNTSPKSGSKRSAGHVLNHKGLTIERMFTRPGADPFEGIEWDLSLIHI